MIGAPNEIRERGFESPPPRRALGARFKQGVMVGVAPLFVAVAVLVDGDG